MAWRAERAAATGSQFTPDDEFNADWFALHPPGWVEYVEAMRPEGTYGRWLRTLPVAVELDGVLFIHAGISPEMKGMTVEAINTRAAEEISRFDADRERMVAEGMCLPVCSAREMVEVINGEIAYLNTLDASQRNKDNPRMTRAADLQHLGQWGSWSVLTDTGPLWFKGTSQWDEKQYGDEMDDILAVAGCRTHGHRPVGRQGARHPHPLRRPGHPDLGGHVGQPLGRRRHTGGARDRGR